MSNKTYRIRRGPSKEEILIIRKNLDTCDEKAKHSVRMDVELQYTGLLEDSDYDYIAMPISDIVVCDVVSLDDSDSFFQLGGHCRAIIDLEQLKPTNRPRKIGLYPTFDFRIEYNTETREGEITFL
ncbi:hypothetical protein IKF02_04445 [Candidatus Saccharibacteria bacterium]|nr:hypothetical protein [Candidatus Saccharibacteria bacterium]